MNRATGVTLKEIARQAGCSITVVSKVLNGARGSAGAGPETRARILLLARQLGYSPNFHARALQEGRSHTIGLVFRLHDGSHFDNDFWGQLIHGVERGVRAAGHDMLVIGPTEEAGELARGMEHLRQQRIDALVVPADIYRGELPDADPNLPIVIAGDASGFPFPSVVVDLEPGCVAAFTHLRALGHRNVLWVPRVQNGIDHDPLRTRQVAQAAERAQIRLRVCEMDLGPHWGEGSAEESIEAVRLHFLEALSVPLGCTAIFAFNERIALGVNGALYERGLRVPDDVSLLAFGDIFAHVATPPMTVVGFALPELGRCAAELGLRIASGDLPAEEAARYRETITACLVVRRSTGPAPA